MYLLTPAITAMTAPETDSIVMSLVSPSSAAVTSATIFCAVMAREPTRIAFSARTPTVPVQASNHPLEAVLPGGISHL